MCACVGSGQPCAKQRWFANVGGSCLLKDCCCRYHKLSRSSELGCMCVGSKVTQFGDNRRAWPYWAQWAVVIIILLVTAVRLSVAGSWRWVRAATGQDMARGGAQGHFYNYTHFNIRLTCYLLAPLRVIRLYGAMKIHAHTHFHKDISHSKFFSVPSYFFW